MTVRVSAGRGTSTIIARSRRMLCGPARKWRNPLGVSSYQLNRPEPRDAPLNVGTKPWPSGPQPAAPVECNELLGSPSRTEADSHPFSPLITGLLTR